MTGESVGVARGILRNAGALFLVGLFAKGMGLVIAVMVARFLGADAMGLFALLFSVAMLLETFISIGMSDSLVRDVAARPLQAFNLYSRSLKLVAAISIFPMLALLLWTLRVDAEATRYGLMVVAIGTPVSAAFVVSQAVLQGTERVLLLAWVTFVARLISLVWLLVALNSGGGVAAALASRVAFQALSVVAFFVVMRRQRNGETAEFTSRSLLTRSLPFALNRALGEIAVRLPSLVLPVTAGLAASGIFDTANRVRSTLGMTMSAAITGMMPSFARQFAGPAADSHQLVGYSLKYMCLAIAAVATVIGLAAEWIIDLLFGADFDAAVRPLEILAWAQVLVAVDAVLQQALLAAGHEYATVRHSSAGVAAQLALILLLASVLDLTGIALAVLLASAVTLFIDLRYLVKHVAAIPVRRFVVGPLAATAVVATAMFVADGHGFGMRVLVAVLAWVVVTLLFGLLPRDELKFMARLAALPGIGRGQRPRAE